MRWLPIARAEYFAAWSSRVTKVLLLIFALVVVLNAYIYPVTQGHGLSTADFAVDTMGDVAFVLALIGLLLGYKAIVEERRHGQLRLVLALPLDRRDVVAGKYLGRGGLLTVVIIVSMLLAGGLVVYPFGELALLGYLGFILLSVALGFIFLGIGMAISTATSTERRSTAATFAVFFVFVLIWDDIPGLIEFLLGQVGLLDGSLPSWTAFFLEGDPISVYGRIIEGFIGGASFDPWYLSEWVALVLFAIWIALPLGLGTYRFEVTDL